MKTQKLSKRKRKVEENWKNCCQHESESQKERDSGRGSTQNGNSGQGGGRGRVRGNNKRGEMSDWQSKSLKSRKNQGKW